MLQGVREMAAAIELLPGDRFRFALSYGALDQHAEGRFRREGTRILLTTEPPPRPPAFSVLDVAKGDPDQLDLLLVGSDGRPIPNIEVEIMLANGVRERAMTGRTSLEIPLDAPPMPSAVRFTIPVFDVASDLFSLDLGRGHSWRFRLDANDIAVRNFRDEAFTLDGACLVPPGAAPAERLCRQDPP